MGYSERVDRGSTHGKVICFINQLQDRSTSLLRYRCNDYLNPNGRPSVGNMLTNNLGGSLFGSSGTTQQPQNTGGGLFGNASGTTNTGGLFGSAQTTNTGTGLFGATQPTTTGGGLFGSAPSNTGGGGLFGATSSPGQTNTGGLFGSTSTSNTGGGLFGNTTASTNTGLFGSTASQPMNQGGGLFGNTTTALPSSTTTGLFGGTGTTGGGLFGSSPQPATSGTGMFGNTNTSAVGSSGLFGTSNTGVLGSTTSAGGGLFGNTTTQPSTTSTGGLFGNNTTQAPATGGLFGSTTTQPTTTGGGLFGSSISQAPASTGGLFGTMTTQPAATGGLFGTSTAAPAANTTGGLFGSTTTNNTTTGTTGGLFGSSTTAGGLFGAANTPSTGTGLFGATQPSPSTNTGGLFGMTNNTSPATGGGGLFGSTATQPTGLGTGNLFGNSTGTTGTTDGLFGNSSNLTGGGLFGNTKPMTQPAGPSIFGLNCQPTNSNPIGNPANAPLCSVVKDDPYNLSSIAIANATNMLYGSAPQEMAVRPVQPRTALRCRKRFYLKQLDPTSQIEDVSNSQSSAPIELKPIDPTQFAQKRNESAQDNVFIAVSGIEPLVQGTIASWGTEHNEGAEAARSQSMAGSPVSRGLSMTNAIADKNIMPILTRPDYSCRPSIEAMSAYSEEQLSRVEDFTLTREGYGSITWPGFTDLRNVNLDVIVDIDNRTVELFGQAWKDYMKSKGVEQPTEPPQGSSLNKRAVVTLYNCGSGSRDKASYARAVRKVEEYTKNELKATFISLSPDGTWTFRVEHFSRYAFPEFESAAPGNTVRKANKRRGQVRRTSIVLKERQKRTNSRVREESPESKTEHTINIVSNHQPPSSAQKRLTADDLWAIAESSRTLPSSDVNDSIRRGELFDTQKLVLILRNAKQRVDPVVVGQCLRHHGDVLLDLTASIWSGELDLLGGIITWLYKMNRQHEDSIIDLLLANRGAAAATKCLNQLKKPRLSLIIAASSSPALMAQPRIAEQLVQYRKQQLTVANVEVCQILNLLSGVLCKGESEIQFKSWTQAFAALLVFEFNATFLRFNLATYADQIRVLRCAMYRLVSIYGPQAETFGPEWSLLCYIAMYGGEPSQEPDSESEPTTYPLVTNEDITRIAEEFERDDSDSASVCRWLMMLYKIYSCNPDVSLVEALQQSAQWVPSNFDHQNNNVIWGLIRYQQTRNKGFLTKQLFTEYCSTHDVAKGSHSLHSGAGSSHNVASDSARQSDAFVASSAYLPLWFIYQCVGEEFLKRKRNLAAASAFFNTYKVISGSHTGSDSSDFDDQSWWAVLKTTFKKPDEGESMTQILSALVSNDYLSQLYAMILEAIRPGKTNHRASEIDARLLDILVDLRLLQLVEALHSFKQRLDVAELAGRRLSQSEIQFMYMWKEQSRRGVTLDNVFAEMSSVFQLLEWVSGFIEYIMASGHQLETAKERNEHRLSTRAMENIKGGCGMSADEFRAMGGLNYPASLF